MNATTVKTLNTEQHSSRHFLTFDLFAQDKVDAILPEAPSMKTKTLVCVIDPDNAFRENVSRLLRSEKYDVEAYSSTQGFLSRDIFPGPCCVVLDVHLPDINGLTLQQILLKDHRTEQVIFVSGKGDVASCARAFKAGAVDFLAKPLKEPELLRAVADGLRRSIQIRRELEARRSAQAMLDRLTPREREVMSFVIAGRLNKVIAAELGTAEKTIKKHRGQLMRKLNFNSVAELVHFACQYGVKPACAYGT